MAGSYPVPPEFARKAHIDDARYRAMYQESVANPDGFWAARAREFIDWHSEWSEVSWSDLPAGRVEWFRGATLNASYN